MHAKPFHQYQSFMDPRHPHHSRQNFDARKNFTNHANHAKYF